jgi:hypothetical protein
LLPIQLIPYFQYTVSAVIGTLLMGFRSWQMGQQGFYGATESMHPDSDMTPYLVFCWLAVVLRGLRRGHAVLKRFYDLSCVHSIEGTGLWEEVAGYFLAFGWKPEVRWGPRLMTLLRRYSHVTTQFLFGTASQQRNSIRHCAFPKGVFPAAIDTS